MLRKDTFKKRFNDYYPMLCKIAFGYIPNTEECEDIVQECFIAVWNKEKDALNEKEFLAYMIRAVKNNCISFLRKQSFNLVSLEDTPIASEPLDSSDEERKDSPSYEEILASILSILPPKCKEIYLMSKLEGLKYKEIAQRLNLSEKTVENQMGKAIRLVREQVKSGKFVFYFLFILWMIKN